ncbi:MAG: CHAD domain-containing protein [Anaerolineales bacterium]
MSTILLTDDQKSELLRLSQTAPELLVHRARLILAYADGKPTMQAAGEAGISRGRARYWKRQFLARGMEIFDLDLSGEISKSKSASSTGKQSKDTSPDTALEQLLEDVGAQLEIPYPKPLPSIGINPDDTLAEAGRKVWLYHFALMINHEEGTLRGDDNEELHDMRVATRRMRSAFDIFSPAFNPKIMKRYLNGLRKAGNVLGKVRDMDVILDNALTYQKNSPKNMHSGLEPLLADYRRQIEKKRSKMTRHLQSKEYQNFKNNFNLFLQRPDSIKDSNTLAEGINSRLRDTVPVLIYSRYAAVRAYETILPTASMNQLHALRIEFKKFRYALEYFREILGENVGQIISELKQLQDHLGELHDADVACDLIRDFLVAWEGEQAGIPIAERVNPEPIVTYLAYSYAERYRLTSSFPGLWIKFSRSEFRQNIAQAIALL